ncbi:MAG: hypothetical protein JWO05_913 [Gemmatimonadetes bacterium]|nr:hypothetical protein [Gemmatimonadota bacterium]
MTDDTFRIAISIVASTFAFVSVLRVFRGAIEAKYSRPQPVADQALLDRLERIEIAVESTAVEVERISESHRFMAKLLSERAAAPISVPAAAAPGNQGRVITPH